MAAPSASAELATLLRTTPAASVPPTHRPLVRVDDKEPVSAALASLSAARVLSCPVYSRQARRYTALLDAIDVAVSLFPCGTDGDGGDGGGGGGARLSEVLARPCGAVANASGANALVGLDAGAPLAVAVARMASGGAHRLALVEPGGGLADLLTQSAVVASLAGRGVFWAPPLEGLPVSAVVGAAGGGEPPAPSKGEGASPTRPVVSLTSEPGVTLRSALSLLVRGDVPTVAVVDSSGLLVGKLSPADVRALLGGVVASASAAAAGGGGGGGGGNASGSPAPGVDEALERALGVSVAAWLDGQSLTTTALASAPASGVAPTRRGPKLPPGIGVASNALTVMPATPLTALVDTLVATGQHHAFVTGGAGGTVDGVVSLTDVLAAVASAAGV